MSSIVLGSLIKKEDKKNPRRIHSTCKTTALTYYCCTLQFTVPRETNRNSVIMAKLLLKAIIICFTYYNAYAACGCDDCTLDILDRLVGSPPYSCIDRFDYLQTPAGGSLNEEAACRRVAGTEFRDGDKCGPYCDPDRCDRVMTPYPTLTPVPPSDLYCFPAAGARVEYTNMWSTSSGYDGYTVQVKERGEACGPGFNKFSADTVTGANNGNELTLEFKLVNGAWSASEVRVLLPNANDKYNYGDYRFHIKTVEIIDSADANADPRTVLPKDLVIGLFTWDTTDRFVEGNPQNWMHEVDVEISRWSTDTNADVQFLVQPPLDPQMYRFFSGADGTSYNQSGNWYSFNWLPNGIYWSSTAGASNGQTHDYTVEDSVSQHRQDYVQCLPNNVEIRMNLWNTQGVSAPDGLSDTDYVKVVIDNFQYIESDQKHIPAGNSCSKHCQCVGDCIDGRCEAVEVDSFEPSLTPSVHDSVELSQTPSVQGSSESSNTPSSTGDTASPTISSEVPSSSPVVSCEDSPFAFIKNAKERTCDWVGIKKDKIAQRCRGKAKFHCRSTCGKCQICRNSRAKFEWKTDTADTFKKCSFIKKKNLVQRCQITGVKESCPKLCNEC
jgi:hypothetical protein